MDLEEQKQKETQEQNQDLEQEQDIDYTDDIFSEVNNIKSDMFKEGYKMGQNEQRQQGEVSQQTQNYQEGFIIGRELGKEIGQYMGFLDTFDKIKDGLDGYIKHKSQIDKRVLTMKQIIMEIDFNSVSLDIIAEKLFLLRSKFSALVSSLGLKKV